jgi:hypothetical protein
MNDTEKLLPQDLVTLNADMASGQNTFILVFFIRISTKVSLNVKK